MKKRWTGRREGETDEGRGKKGDREGGWERKKKRGKKGNREGGWERQKKRGREGETEREREEGGVSQGKGLMFVTHPVVSGSGKDHRV